MIKVFTTTEGASTAGAVLTRQFDSWLETFKPYTINIVNIHTNSNKFGWMVVIHYEIVTGIEEK